MKKLLLLLLPFSLGTVSMAQVMNATPDVLAELFKKPIRIEFADTTAPGREKIVAYPQKNLGYLIKAAAEEVWKLNGKVEYMVQDELKRNLDKGEPRNAYLFLSKHPDSKPGKEIWILNYSGGLNYKDGKVDYQIYLPDISLRSIKEFTQFDIEFTMSTMQEHMKHVQKSGKKITPSEFFYLEAAKNCKTLKTTPLHMVLDKNYISESVDDKVMRRNIKRMNFSLGDAGQINQWMTDNRDTLALVLHYPAKFESLNTSALGEKYIFWNKVMVSAQNHKVVGVVGNGRKDNVLIEIEGDDLLGLSKCD